MSFDFLSFIFGILSNFISIPFTTWYAKRDARKEIRSTKCDLLGSNIIYYLEYIPQDGEPIEQDNVEDINNHNKELKRLIYDVCDFLKRTDISHKIKWKSMNYEEIRRLRLLLEGLLADLGGTK
ncbi:hypothetical protein KAU45_03125 [bacterium]|nr:hypothetical protein [bacterium]